MSTFRGRSPIKAPAAATFAAVSVDVSMCSSFGVVLHVAAGATATFTITDQDGIDIAGDVDLVGLTSDARVDFGADEFAGGSILVACTAYSGSGSVAAYIDRVE